MMKHPSPIVGAGLLALLVLVVPVSGRVFRSLGPTKVPELNNGLYPWENAYQTTMTVNGKPTEMRLYSVRFSQPVVEQLKGRFEDLGAAVVLNETPDGATGMAKWPDGQEARFLVLSPASEPRHLVFVFYPEPGSNQDEVRFPVPKYDRGTVESTVSNEKTDTFSATLSTPDSATQVHSFYASRMAAEGWTLVAPATVGNGTIGGMAVFMKRSQVCYVQSTDKPGQPNMVTLLVKGGRL